jgi:hypothetical protein
VTGSFDTDNPWTPGQVINFTGLLQTTGQADSWTLTIDYPASVSGAASGIARGDAVHTISITTPTSDAPGRITITMDRSHEPAGVEHNLGTENWTVTIGNTSFPAIITNPSTAAVYRWLGNEHTTADPDGITDQMTGNQAVVIK